MKFKDMLKFNSKSEPSPSVETNTNNANVKIPSVSTFSTKDILVEYDDVIGKFSDNVKSGKNKKNPRSKKETDYEIFTMKMYGGEKSTLEALSEAANTDMSSFARKRIFSDEKIIILDKGNYISRALIEISDTLRCSKLEEPESRELIKKIFEQLCDIAKMHVAICKELTIFKESTGDEEI